MSVSVKDLIDESLSHRAVSHPYLQALGSADLPDVGWALRDFAEQYYGYSLHFPRYLTTVISKLETPAHRTSLLQNLMEESGMYEEEEYAELAAVGVEREWIEGVPHPQLFQRFREASGITAPHSSAHWGWVPRISSAPSTCPLSRRCPTPIFIPETRFSSRCIRLLISIIRRRWKKSRWSLPPPRPARVICAGG